MPSVLNKILKKIFNIKNNVLCEDFRYFLCIFNRFSSLQINAKGLKNSNLLLVFIQTNPVFQLAQ